MIATRNISVQIPSDIFIALNVDEIEMGFNLKSNYAIEMFRNGKLTIGKAAEFAGMKRSAFQNLLALNNISFSNLRLNEINDDVQKITHLLDEKENS